MCLFFPLSTYTDDVTDASLFFAFSYEFGGPKGVVAMMIGFPILMYYLWICLWFYDGQLVHPRDVSDIQPFIQRMWAHVKQVTRFKTPVIGPTELPNLGCSPNIVHIRHVYFAGHLPTHPCVCHAWLLARRSTGSITQLQNSLVQMQRTVVVLLHHGYCHHPSDRKSVV